MASTGLWLLWQVCTLREGLRLKLAPAQSDVVTIAPIQTHGCVGLGCGCQRPVHPGPLLILNVPMQVP